MAKVYVSVPYSGTIRVHGSLEVCVDVPPGMDPMEFVRQKGEEFVMQDGEAVNGDEQHTEHFIERVGLDEPENFWAVSSTSRVVEE